MTGNRTARLILQGSAAFALLFAIAAPVFAVDEKNEPPLPYYASMKFPETNMRVGPGKDYPINWVYHRKGLPVKVIDQHQEWRNVVDSEGDRGWIAINQISLARSIVVTSPLSTLRANPSEDANPIAKVEGSVVGKVIGCTTGWCQVDLATHRGWLEKTVLWGVAADETIAGK